MKNTFKLCFLLFTIMVASCREEDFVPDTFGSVFGQVLVEGSNSVIEDATVTTNPPTNILSTDELGRFALEDIKTGSYTIRVEKLGYVTKVENIAIIDNQSVNVVIRLTSDSLANNAPSLATQPSPVDGAVDLETSVALSWTAEDADDDALTYDLKLYNFDQSQEITIAEDLTSPNYQLTGLDFGTIYYWQVIVKDGQATPVNGTLWQFKTEDFPDHRFLFTKYENGNYNIYSSDENDNPIQLTDNGANNWRPRMNPGRNKIAFLSSIGLETHLFKMNRDGSEIEQISSIPVFGSSVFELDFSWSPDGEKLLYMSGNKLYTVNHDGTGTALFSEAPNGFVYAECDWSLVDNRVMARMVGDNSYNSIIYLYEGNGNFIQSLLTDIPGSTNGAVFSVDGGKIIYTHDVSGHEVPDGRQLDARIFIRSLVSPIPEDISGNKMAGTNDLDARISPDGAWVIFVNTNNDGISQKNIYRMEIDGTERELLFENAEMPEWR